MTKVLLSVLVLGFMASSSVKACTATEAEAALKTYLNSPVLYQSKLLVKRVSEKFNGAIDGGRFYLMTARTSMVGNFDMFTYVTVNADTCSVRTAVQDGCQRVEASGYNDLVLDGEPVTDVVPAIKAICSSI